MPGYSPAIGDEGQKAVVIGRSWSSGKAVLGFSQASSTPAAVGNSADLALRSSSESLPTPYGRPAIAILLGRTRQLG